jgi:hypothetical protein
VNRYRHLAATVLILLGLAVAMVVTDGATWGGEPSGCVAAADCSCEAFRSGGFAVQPTNTVSSLGFVAVGLAILWGVGRRGGKGEILTVAYGMAVVGIGVGSALFHGTVTSWGGWADLVGVYALLSLIIAINVSAPSRRTALVLFGGSATALAALQIPLHQGTGKYVLGVLVVGAVASEVVLEGTGRDRRWLLGAAVLLAAAFAIWSSSRTGAAWCEPRSLLQGHGVWHLGAAAAVGLLYRYLRPELVEN